METNVSSNYPHYIQLGVYLNDKREIEVVSIDDNTTDLPSDSELIKIVSFSLLKSIDFQPFTGDMWAFLLVNALRCLTEEQRAGLCFDLYSRSELTDSLDKNIQQLKLERETN